ncbi:MAG: MarR family EPS-associated transcriptional regulator [Candidatus Omnitrophica bacterium]|nr:MarR family EPS-associated transcriptional regulator [Candidatus Omnitrophota bacterium]MBU2437509.1 MarR family EPS-associated transcriptional regulator [Candidatus Omnitrophota bacterium]
MYEHSVKEDVFNTLRILSSNGHFTQRDLSAHLGISLGKANYLIQKLIRKGLVKIENFSKGDNKLKKIKYILTKRGFEEKLHLTHHFLKRKETEYNHIKKEWEQLAVNSR